MGPYLSARGFQDEVPICIRPLAVNLSADALQELARFFVQACCPRQQPIQLRTFLREVLLEHLGQSVPQQLRAHACLAQPRPYGPHGLQSTPRFRDGRRFFALDVARLQGYFQEPRLGASGGDHPALPVSHEHVRPKPGHMTGQPDYRCEPVPLRFQHELLGS